MIHRLLYVLAYARALPAGWREFWRVRREYLDEYDK